MQGPCEHSGIGGGWGVLGTGGQLERDNGGKKRTKEGNKRD